jgi:hypothetical protein
MSKGPSSGGKLLSVLSLLLILNQAIHLSAQSDKRNPYAPLEADPNVKFEVISIKNSAADERGSGLYTYPGARVVTHNMTVRYLIALA